MTAQEIPVDPSVYELAERFVYEMLRSMNRPLVPSERQPLIQRAAEAMQRAIEDELNAMEAELAS